VRVKIHGKVWTIRDADIKEWGLCYATERLIEIRQRQRVRNRLDTLIHELLHAGDPTLKEEMVTKLAGIITNVLWRDGWRRTSA